MRSLRAVAVAAAAVLAAAPSAAPAGVPRGGPADRAPPASTAAPSPSREAAAGFGEIEVQAPAGRPERVVLLLSGAGGLDAGAREVAAALAAGGALVVGVDVGAWLAARPPGRCAYPAGDLEELAQGVEKRRGLEAYLHPALVGYGAGASVAWAALAQGPAGTFLGGVAIAPCPDRPLPVKLCAPHGPPVRALPGGDLPALAPPRAALEDRPSVPQVVVQRSTSRTTDRDHPLLAALAEDAHHALAEVEVGTLEADELADAQAARVQQLEDGAIATRARAGSSVASAAPTAIAPIAAAAASPGSQRARSARRPRPA